MSNTCGLGGWVGPKPGDPDNHSILRATPTFGGIDVEWTYPTINPHAVAYTLLFRARSSNFAEATEIAVVNASFYYDKLDDDLVYYYWIKFVSVNGTVGELIGPAFAQSRPRLLDYMEQLTARIDNSLLGIALRSKLDELSWINANLNEEIFDRESGQTSFAQALRDVQLGIAEAHTFITTERLSRVTANSAIAEQIDLLAVTLSNNVAAVDVTSRAWITELNGKVTSIGAMWTAKVTVNGLIGGFGVYNDGQEVLAGFDVDTFFVGRTQANKRKPFIIEGGQVFIDQAFINKLMFIRLTDENGTFIVQDGKVKAQYIETNGLIINSQNVKDDWNHPIFSAGGALDWSRIEGFGKPANGADVTSQNTAAGVIGQGALATKNHVNIGSTVKFADGSTMQTTDFVNRLSQITPSNIGLFMANAAIGTAYIGNAAVNTLQIAGQAVTIPITSSGGYTCYVSTSVPYGQTINFYITATWRQGTGRNSLIVRLLVDDISRVAEAPGGGTLGTMTYSIELGFGYHTFTVVADDFTGDMACSIMVLGAKR